MCHLGHVTGAVNKNFCFPFPEMLHLKFGFDWPRGSIEKSFEKCEWTTDRHKRMGTLEAQVGSLKTQKAQMS